MAVCLEGFSEETRRRGTRMTSRMPLMVWLLLHIRFPLTQLHADWKEIGFDIEEVIKNEEDAKKKKN